MLPRSCLSGANRRPYTNVPACSLIAQLATCFALLLAAASGQYIPIIATTPVFGTTFSGATTYFGVQSPYASGSCSFQYSGLADSAAYAGIPLALSDAQYTGSSVCGMCIKYRGTGAGSGVNPIPTVFQLGFVCDVCPECEAGDLDLQLDGDGRWGSEWYPTQCPVGRTTFRYSFVEGGNSLFRRMQVANARVPVAAVKVFNSASGTWFPLAAQYTDNYWDFAPTGNMSWAAGCTIISLTSLLGDIIEDRVCCVLDGYASSCTGTAQFPCRLEYPAEDAECKFQPTCGRPSAGSGCIYSCPPPLTYDACRANQTNPDNETCCIYTPTCGRPAASSTASYSCKAPLVFDASKQNETVPDDETCCKFVPSCGQPSLGSAVPFQCPYAWLYDESKAAVTGALTSELCCRQELVGSIRRVRTPHLLGGLPFFHRPLRMQLDPDKQSLRVGKGISITINLPDPPG